jgi:hypothetical protein
VIAPEPTTKSITRLVLRPRQSNAPLAPSTALTVMWAMPLKPAAGVRVSWLPTSCAVTLALSLVTEVMKSASPASGSAVRTLTVTGTPVVVATVIGWMIGA